MKTKAGSFPEDTGPHVSPEHGNNVPPGPPPPGGGLLASVFWAVGKFIGDVLCGFGD